jgi:hypothetical protein
MFYPWTWDQGPCINNQYYTYLGNNLCCIRIPVGWPSLESLEPRRGYQKRDDCRGNASDRSGTVHPGASNWAYTTA